MNRTVTIAGKEYGVSINALTPVLYHQVFKKNFFEEIQNIQNNTGVLKEIAYIMVKRYEAGSPDKMALSLADYEQWLEGFGMFDFELSGAEIAAIITEQSQVTVVPKE